VLAVPVLATLDVNEKLAAGIGRIFEAAVSLPDERLIQKKS
jgi:hypothetical protein